MLKPSFLKSSFPKYRIVNPARILYRFLFLALIALPLMAVGQDFTMTVTNPYPAAVNAGQDSRSYITLGAVNGFTGSVSLSCAVSPLVQFGPVCTPPETAIPPQQVAMSITVDSQAPAGFYTLTVTGTAPAPSTTKTVNISLTVLPVSPNYTLAVTSAIFPTSLHAGLTAEAQVTVSPISGYVGTVTLSCSSITPIALPAPSCSFSPTAVSVPGPPSTLTITTTGNTAPPPAAGLLPGGFIGAGGTWPYGSGVYGLWLTSTGLGLAALFLSTSASGRRRRKIWALSVLFATASLLLLPACSTKNTNTGLNGNTPKNTYVFTLTGADSNGLAPSNEATPPTVSLTVN